MEITKRNYQLDVLKLFFTLMVFLYHTGYHFSNENTTMPFEMTWQPIGQVSVHSFFIISGLLMINSFCRKADVYEKEPGKYALGFTMNKYKAIALPYLTALFIHVCIYFYCHESDLATEKLPMLVPEILPIFQSGVNVSMINFHTWYISAMLISLLPLSYILFKNKDLYINVFAPVAALLTMGFMYSSEYTGSKHHLLGNNMFCGFINGGLIRAACGICFGAVAWLIYKKIDTGVKEKKQRILLTIAEILLYLLFFYVWFHTDGRPQYTYIAKLLLPVIIAVVFSQKSYISCLFKSKLFSKCGSLSLAIYLTHWAGEKIIKEFYPDESFKYSLLLMVIFTACSCVVYYLLMFLAKFIWSKKLRELFVASYK